MRKKRKYYKRTRVDDPPTDAAGLVVSILALLFIYGYLKFRTDRAAMTVFFWKIAGLALLASVLVVVVMVIYYRSAANRSRKLMVEVERLGLSENVENWLSVIGRAKEKGEWWTYRGYVFTEDRIGEFARFFALKGLIVTPDQMKEVLKYRIDVREVEYVAAVGEVAVDEIDKMSGTEFERFLGRLYEAMGYKVSLNGGAGDQGGDLICVKDGERILVQAKRWSQAVDNSAVQEAAAAKAHYRCTSSVVVTNSMFTQGAINLAKTNGVSLIDGQELRILVGRHMKVAPVDPPKNKICPRCGGTLVERNGGRGPFLGCSNFATKHCRYMEQL